jgi:hypothetical protein
VRRRRGEVLQYDRHRGQHHVLYEDGEDEALRLGAEAIRWLGPASESPCAAGLPAGRQHTWRYTVFRVSMSRGACTRLPRSLPATGGLAKGFLMQCVHLHHVMYVATTVLIRST